MPVHAQVIRALLWTFSTIRRGEETVHVNMNTARLDRQRRGVPLRWYLRLPCLSFVRPSKNARYMHRIVDVHRITRP